MDPHAQIEAEEQHQGPENVAVSRGRLRTADELRQDARLDPRLLIPLKNRSRPNAIHDLHLHRGSG